MENKDWEAIEAGSSSRSHSSHLIVQLPNSLDDDEDLIHIIPVSQPIKTDEEKPQKELKNEEPSLINMVKTESQSQPADPVVNDSLVTIDSAATSERTSPSNIPPSQLRKTSDPLAASTSNDKSRPLAPIILPSQNSMPRLSSMTNIGSKTSESGATDKIISLRKFDSVPTAGPSAISASSAAASAAIKNDVDMLVEEMLQVISPSLKTPPLKKNQVICRVYIANRWTRSQGNRDVDLPMCLSCNLYHPTRQELELASSKVAAKKACLVSSRPIPSPPPQQHAVPHPTASLSTPPSNPQEPSSKPPLPKEITPPTAPPPSLTSPKKKPQLEPEPPSSQSEAPAPLPPSPNKPPPASPSLGSIKEEDIVIPTIRSANGLLMSRVGDDLFPIRPHAQVCRHFIGTGECRWGRECHHHHPVRRARKALFDLLLSGDYKPGKEGDGSSPLLPGDEVLDPGTVSSFLLSAGNDENEEIGEDDYDRDEEQEESSGSAEEGEGAAAGVAQGADDEAGKTNDKSSAEGVASVKREVLLTTYGRTYVVAFGYKMPVQQRRKLCRNLPEWGLCTYGMQCHFHHPADYDYKPHEGPRSQRKGNKGDVADGNKGDGNKGDVADGAETSPTATAAATTATAAAIPPPAATAPPPGPGGKNSSGNNLQPDTATAANPQPAAASRAPPPSQTQQPAQQQATVPAGGMASTLILLRAIDLIWSPVKQKDPKIWALNHAAKYLLLNSAAQVRILTKKASASSTAVPALIPTGKYSNDDMKLASSSKGQNLKELLAEVEKAQDSTSLQHGEGLTSVMLGQEQLATHGLPLAKIGAELGLLWQKMGTGDYGVRIGQLYREDHKSHLPSCEIFSDRTSAGSHHINLTLTLGGLRDRSGSLLNQVLNQALSFAPPPPSSLPSGPASQPSATATATATVSATAAGHGPATATATAAGGKGGKGQSQASSATSSTLAGVNAATATAAFLSSSNTSSTKNPQNLSPGPVSVSPTRPPGGAPNPNGGPGGGQNMTTPTKTPLPPSSSSSGPQTPPPAPPAPPPDSGFAELHVKVGGVEGGRWDEVILEPLMPEALHRTLVHPLKPPPPHPHPHPHPHSHANHPQIVQHSSHGAAGVDGHGVGLGGVTLGQVRDEGVWRLLALLPPWIATQVEPFAWGLDPNPNNPSQPASPSPSLSPPLPGVLASIKISSNGLPILRFLGGAKKILDQSEAAIVNNNSQAGQTASMISQSPQLLPSNPNFNQNIFGGGAMAGLAGLGGVGVNSNIEAAAATHGLGMNGLGMNGLGMNGLGMNAMSTSVGGVGGGGHLGQRMWHDPSSFLSTHVQQPNPPPNPQGPPLSPLVEALERLGSCSHLIAAAWSEALDLVDSSGGSGGGGKVTQPSLSLSLSSSAVCLLSQPGAKGRGYLPSCTQVWEPPQRHLSVDEVEDPFQGQDAMLVPGTLHRAMATRDAYGTISSLTYRIGRQPIGLHESSPSLYNPPAGPHPHPHSQQGPQGVLSSPPPRGSNSSNSSSHHPHHHHQRGLASPPPPPSPPSSPLLAATSSRSSPGHSPALLLADVLSSSLSSMSTKHLPLNPSSTPPRMRLKVANPALYADGALVGHALHVTQPSPPGLLILGPPGSGKSTLLRSLARAAAQHLDKTVLVLDNSWELGGLPLTLLGRQGSSAAPSDPGSVADLGPGTQRICLHHLIQQQQAGNASQATIARAVVSALAFHTPDLVIMDDLQSELDVSVACQLSARGIAVIAAAHSRDLATLVHSGGELSAACGIAPAGGGGGDGHGSRSSEAVGGRADGGGNSKNLGGGGGGMVYDSPSRSAPIRLGLPGFSSAVELQAAGEGAVSALLGTSQRSFEAIAAANGSVGLVVRVHHDIVASIKELLMVAGSPDHLSARNSQTSQLRYMDLATGRVIVQC